MNTKKISFVVNGQTKAFEVQDCYPYLENQIAGKVVLVVSAKEEDATASDLEALKNNESGEIEFYIKPAILDKDGISTGEYGDWELAETYTDYNSGEICTSYQNGIRECRVTRIDGMVKELAQQRADIDFIAAMADIPLE